MSPDSFRLLVAAGDDSLRRNLASSLVAAGFHPEEATGAEETLEAVRQRRFDLVLLSFDLPEAGGLETCRRLRGLMPDLGIVMLRHSGSPEDDLRALDAGADDCIAAPFRFREIVARVSSVLRRLRSAPAQGSDLLRAGELELDVERHLLRRGGHQVHLSPHEFELLLFFMRNQEVTLTHARLLHAVWGTGPDRGYLRSYIKILRRKIERNPSHPEYILTEPWVGYRFHNPPRA